MEQTIIKLYFLRNLNLSNQNYGTTCFRRSCKLSFSMTFFPQESPITMPSSLSVAHPPTVASTGLMPLHARFPVPFLGSAAGVLPAPVISPVMMRAEAVV